MKTADQLQQLAAWLADTDIGLLELRTPEGMVRLGRSRAPSRAIVQLDADDDGSAPAPAADTATAVASSAGVFLHGHPMHLVPLARVGERVVAGQPVGLLQIGPLLLPVAAPLAGVIAAVCVAAGCTVGYGTALVELQPFG
ncbi:acetyl-CoA carboxylase biotin carboxyl carrier protein subunit [Variovorax sp. J22G21]|uniref:acetyl-CoA carboxylase biotin carboxyl carrier protein subunit n=1 Tax=Variovorax fucosicus TaxID=3053517 RepID=UPI0025784FE3|nr:MULTISPECIES: acetyl-CoA carboxylase biotin carboxyl carrier protein subunit [unclassified Variovorax]MDM0039861.1 acetyl-CoA carboxylase biotin carboxyl carrier protein subunit [Variovorax sp. J22R193]MDM0064590.1 acetyl-CoA carboxylase biotin carboxyl carrier protein subunit [Variovorax sp. J22G21]